MQERRVATITDLELREAGNGFTFSGYAAVFDSPTDLGPFREQIAPGAFKRTLQHGADVRLLVNHDGVPLARTKSGTLHLEEDDRGLRVQADLDPTNPAAQELRSAMARGDLDQMSFAFQTPKGGDEWDDDAEPPLRTLREVKLFDVSAVTYPAYEDTTAEMRSVVEEVFHTHTADEPQTDPAEGTSETEPALDHSLALVRARNDNRRRRIAAGLTKAS